MGYAVEQKSQIHSELALLTPRLKVFATALTGSESMSVTLLKATRHHLAAKVRERGHVPLALWAFTQMHALWASRMKPPRGERPQPADPRLFCPRGQSADSQRVARLIAQLSPQQRATLHLVYGERYSYDEVAEVFNVPVQTVMTRLVRSHAMLAQNGERDAQNYLSEPKQGGNREGNYRQGQAA